MSLLTEAHISSASSMESPVFIGVTPVVVRFVYIVYVGSMITPPLDGHNDYHLRMNLNHKE